MNLELLKDAKIEDKRDSMSHEEKNDQSNLLMQGEVNRYLSCGGKSEHGNISKDKQSLNASDISNKSGSSFGNYSFHQASLNALQADQDQ